MKFKFDFIPQGAVVKTEGDKFIFKSFFQGKESIKEWDKSSTIVFDTGNQLGDGIIDHHLPGTADSCVASLVVLKLKSLIPNIQEGTEEITFITHFFPDFDAIGGVYYAKKYFESGDMPIGAVTLSEYINEVDSGKLTLDPKSPINPASMILSISDAISKDNSIAFPEKHEKILQESFQLLDKITKIFETKDNPWMPDFLDELEGFDHLKENILNDVNAYKLDLSNSVTQSLKLINNETGIIDDVDFIATDNPKSFLWKYWVRGDRENSAMGQGFIFTCAFFDTFKDKGRNRAIISTDPNTPYALKGLGLLIDKLEIAKLLQEYNETKESLCENSRPGFHRADPWYDGRAPIHNYTIIDAPRAGSALSNEELLTIIRRFELWQKIGSEIEKWSDFDYVNNFDVSDSELPNEEVLNEKLNAFSNFDYKDLEENYNLLGSHLKAILEYPVYNGYVSIKNKNLREIAFEGLTEFLIKLSSVEINEWSLKISNIVTRYFPAEYSQRLLQNTKELNLISLKMLVNRCINEISVDQVYPLFLSIIDNHKAAFSELRNQYFNSDFLDINIDKRAKFVEQLIINHKIIEPSSTTMENNPIYSLKFFKEFIDNMLVSSSFSNFASLPNTVSSFIRNDFAELFESYRSSSFFEDKKGSYYHEYRKVLNQYLIEPTLGENLSKFRVLRAELLASEVGKKFGKYKKLNPEDFLSLEYEEFKQVFDHFNTILDIENKNQNQFLKFVRILYSVSILKNLMHRVSKLFDFNNFNSNEIVQNFLEEYHTDIFYFRIFIEKFFFATIEQYYKISNDGINTSMNELVDLVNLIKTLPQTTKINYANHVENLYSFISNIITLNDMPLREMESYIQTVYAQYSFLTKENENYFDSINALPEYFSSSLSEIMFSYKKYYSELLYFLQTELNSISDNIQNGNEEHYYYYLSSKLTTNTILYDWEYIKKSVDFSNDQSLSKDFYSKYFTWKQITDKQENTNSIEAFKVIVRL